MHHVMTQSESILPIQRMCELNGITRSGYYRMKQPIAGESPRNIEAVNQIHDVCQEMNRYGYRRVTAELHRREFNINHKCVLRLMRRDNLLCRRKKKWIRTTNSLHPYPVYPNLAHGLVPTQLNQLWVADITYVHLEYQFVYVAVILDAFSRRAIGWSLRCHLDTQLSLTALRMALATRKFTAELIHHSDRGVQYAAGDYTDLLTKNNITISMSRKGNPYDNARAESFMKTLKHEEVLLNEYDTLADAEANIDRFINKVYNSKRLHSSLGYRPPMEFEADFLNSLNQQSSTLTTELTVPC